MIAAVQQSGNMQAQPEVARACPTCGSEMVLRVAKKGSTFGERILGLLEVSRLPGRGFSRRLSGEAGYNR